MSRLWKKIINKASNIMDISDKDKALLQRLVTDDAFDLMRHIANALLQQWNQNPINENSAFLTAKETIKREERKAALNSFFKTMEELCHR
jgi:thioredoxin-like negative regulator of GroEL